MKKRSPTPTIRGVWGLFVSSDSCWKTVPFLVLLQFFQFHPETFEIVCHVLHYLSLMQTVNFLRDEGGPFEVGLQEQASNCLNAALVKSHCGERLRKRRCQNRQVRNKETNESKLTEEASKDVRW